MGEARNPLIAARAPRHRVILTTTAGVQEISAQQHAAAAGRKNFLFVGTNEAGENLAGLYSLIATCEANGVNPVDYLADVLIRVQTHPASRIDELLPHKWKPPRPVPSA